MTLLAPIRRNAPVARFEIEPFKDLAFQELASFSLVETGVCMNPVCSRGFDPSRQWQRYCSQSCRKMDELDMRRIGHKVAPALLAWRAGKYEKQNDDLRALSRAGRNYVSRVASEWWSDRQRIAAGQGASSC
jgi:hypothetical protein